MKQVEARWSQLKGRWVCQPCRQSRPTLFSIQVHIEVEHFARGRSDFQLIHQPGVSIALFTKREEST